MVENLVENYQHIDRLTAEEEEEERERLKL